MISFVYFDVGGVVISDLTDGKKWGQMKKDMGVGDEIDKEFESWFDKVEKQMCVGTPADSFIVEMKAKFGLVLADDYSIQGDMLNRFDTNESVWPIIGKIQKKCRTGLLTNMYPDLLSDIKKRGLLPNFDWEIVIDSSLEKIAKPDVGIFEIAEKRASVPPSEILFIENSQRHIEAARSMGWQTFWYDSKNPHASSVELEKFVESIW